MIGMLMAAGLSARAAKIIAYVAIPILILIAFYLTLDAYGDSRQKAGEDAADRRWQEASQKLERQAEQSARLADTKAAATIAQHNERVAAEKERLDEAEREGTSPLDVLFGTDGLP